MGQQQPAEAGAIGLAEGHLLAQGGGAEGGLRRSGVRAWQHSSRSKDASGLSTELSGRRKPPELSNILQPGRWSAQR